MGKRRIMILGAGIYQVPLIMKAREMGLETLVASTPGSYPGFAYADKPLFIDTRDGSAVLAAAEENRIDGIVTTGTDVAVRTVGVVCTALHLPGISEEAAAVVTDKAEMKRAFSGSVSTAPFKIVQNLSEAEAAAEEIGYPVMMKAADVSGSRGVTMVREPSSLPAAFAAARAASTCTHYIVEKYVEGHEIGLDAFVENGRIRYAQPHEKFVLQTGDVTIPAGHAYPFEADAAILAEIHRQLENIVRATGMDNCAINSDLMILPDGSVSVIEAGGRCGATCIPELIELHSGIDYYGQMLRCALGEETDFKPAFARPALAKILFAERDGVIAGIDGNIIQAVREEGFIVGLDYRLGERVRRAANGTDRIGHIYAAEKTEAELDEAVRRVLAGIVLR